jgi:hypothetical protein
LPSKKGFDFGFLPDRGRRVIADQREAHGVCKRRSLLPSEKGFDFGFCLTGPDG